MNMKIHAIIFYDIEKLEPIEHKIYTSGMARYERKFVQEFVEFGRKDFLSKMKVPENEFVISLAGGSLLVYITKTIDVGCAMLMSHVSNPNNAPHLVSKKLIMDYLNYNIIPDNENSILTYFKHKEILAQVDVNKKVLLRSISKVIERGDKIEDLVEQTENLSATSKIFFKHSRKLNRCCWILPRFR